MMPTWWGLLGDAHVSCPPKEVPKCVGRITMAGLVCDSE
jgi:hypothetical protein